MTVTSRGLKKPRNTIVNPIKPDIKKGPPRFVWSRKHWQVDVGATLRDAEPYTQFIEDAVLAQSRDYNKTVYGQSSHKDIVNAEFRPPLTNYYEDRGPLNRVPTKIHAIVPRANPGTAGHDGGTSGYTAKNQRPNNIESALTDRVSTGETRPTFYAPIAGPTDNSVLPDLEMKLPSVSVNAGWEFTYDPGMEYQFKELDDHLGATPIHTGVETQVTFDAPTPLQNLHLQNNRPMVSASAGMNNPLQLDADSSLQNIHLDSHLGATPLQVINPAVEGFSTPIEGSDVSQYLQDGNPAVSYVPPPEVPYKTADNYLSSKPHFREKLQAEKSYGQISQSGASMPRRGLMGPMGVRNIKKKRHPYMPRPKKVSYKV